MLEKIVQIKNIGRFRNYAAMLKKGEKALSEDIVTPETVCAFLNRHGGTLLLGVSDAGKVTGVDPDCKDSVILSAVPHHRTDLILRKVNLDRYDDRDLVTTNLIESYERIIAFIQKHLPDPFYLEGMDRISIRDAIFREVASNILIHREYRNAFPAKLIIERGQVRTENSNNPHGFGTLNPATFTPFPKNPVIGSFFREIGRADELGSGMRKMMKYGKAYGGADPEMIEGDVFRTIVKYPDSAVYEEDSAAIGGLIPEVTPEVGKMLTVIQGEMSRAEIQQKLGLTDEKHFREHYQQAAVAMELIEMTIPDKPRSSKQKYRLTSAGKRLLKSMQK